MDPLTTGALSAIAGKLATTLLSRAGRALKDTPIEAAIKETQAHFRDRVIVDRPLTSWCESDDLREVLLAFEEGQTAPVIEALVMSFLRAGNFYAGEDEQGLATEVVSVFFAELQRAFVLSEEGPAFALARADAQHQQLQASIGGVAGPR